MRKQFAAMRAELLGEIQQQTARLEKYVASEVDSANEESMSLTKELFGHVKSLAEEVAELRHAREQDPWWGSRGSATTQQSAIEKHPVEQFAASPNVEEDITQKKTRSESKKGQ
jgi:hypothetical protein